MGRERGARGLVGVRRAVWHGRGVSAREVYMMGKGGGGSGGDARDPFGYWFLRHV